MNTRVAIDWAACATHFAALRCQSNLELVLSLSALNVDNGEQLAERGRKTHAQPRRGKHRNACSTATGALLQNSVVAATVSAKIALNLAYQNVHTRN